MADEQEQPEPLDQYLYQLSGLESGHDPKAVNKTTGAGGLFQFEPATWAHVREAHPTLNLPATPLEANEDQQLMAARVFTSENATALQKAGVPITAGTLYTAHFLGAGAAEKFFTAMKENPNASFAEIFPQEAAANPTITDGRTLGQFFSQMSGRISGKQGAGNVGGFQSVDSSGYVSDLLSPRRPPLEPFTEDVGDALKSTAKTMAQPKAAATAPAAPMKPPPPPAAPPAVAKTPTVSDLYKALMSKQPINADA